MKSTLKKIQKSDEVTYFHFYDKACNLLQLPYSDRLRSLQGVRKFAEKLYESNALLIKEAGFHSK